jgi:hypothetical protein
MKKTHDQHSIRARVLRIRTKLDNPSEPPTGATVLSQLHKLAATTSSVSSFNNFGGNFRKGASAAQSRVISIAK